MSADLAGPELVTLCDEQGGAIGVERKDRVHDARTALHLAFSCYIFRPDRQLLITRRAFGKRTFPGVRTNSCCGHPAPGEVMEDAIRRRVLFELGLDLGTHAIELMVPRFRYRAVAADGTVENELCPVYRVVLEEDAVDLLPNPDEVDSAWWVPWDAIAAPADVNAEDPLSAWAQQQVDALQCLGPDPLSWPLAPADDLPAAATSAGQVDSVQ